VQAKPEQPQPRRRLICPTCKRILPTPVEKTARQAGFFPFCSERCKLIDLGAWADEQHTIPGNVDADDNDVLSGDLEQP